MTSNPPAQPLFYRQPRLLQAGVHGALRLLDGDYAFAADTNALPITALEFAKAMHDYPIVFAAADDFPVVILGLGQANSFLADGKWADAYVPAYVRRYPFVFADMSGESFALAVDMASGRLVEGGTEGTPLFEDGKPTAITEGAMAFCRDLQGAHLQTMAFASALAERGLLVDQQADARLVSGREMKLAGFRIVDRAKLESLDDATVLDWHRKGWLALIHFHFASLDRFGDLVDRAADVAATTEQKELAA